MAALTLPAVVLLSLTTLVTAFNLDTLHPVIFQGPISRPEAARGDSYFGFAVGLTKSLDGSPWVLVGAPKANSTLGLHSIPETGAMFKCSVGSLGCREVVMDTSDDSRRQGQPPFYYRDRRDGAWIGGALDTDPSPQGKVSVCGHRWMNQLSKSNHYGNG
ncbi:integrin alpha-9-like, partial [Pollicipes pollicipes]|uniref:integrin alpha-9-like n=1 Tax=Pollicipes pollicipes TaxID=41117 RepID=UPI0018855448